MSYQPGRRASCTSRCRTWPIDYAHDPAFARREGFDNLGLIIGTLPDDAAVRAAIRNGFTAALLAWDPVAQREVWRSERRGPWNGGTLAVAGGLVFQGTGDGQFLALDAKTGKSCGRTDNQAATLAGPIRYEVDGEQYVAVPAGYGGSFFLINGMFAPRGRRADQRARPCVQARWDRPEAGHRVRAHPHAPSAGPCATTPAEYQLGADLYDAYCLMCHGIAAVTGGVLPDLRKSGRLQDAGLWKAAVVDAELASRGMPRFAGYVSPPTGS